VAVVTNSNVFGRSAAVTFDRSSHRRDDIGMDPVLVKVVPALVLRATGA
jgi:hypothetical protein